MDVNSVLSEAWVLYTRFFARLVLTAAVVFVVIDLAGALAQYATDSVLAAAVAGVLGLVGLFWLQGALVEGVRDLRDGRFEASTGELYSRTRPRLPALLAAGLVAGLAIGVSAGTLVLLPLAIFLFVRWLFIVPVIVLERRSVREAFGRSWAIAKGHGWSLVWLVLLSALAAVFAAAVLAALFAPLPVFLGAWLGGALAHSVLAPFVVLVWTLAYYRLVGAGRAPAAA